MPGLLIPSLWELSHRTTFVAVIAAIATIIASNFIFFPHEFSPFLRETRISSAASIVGGLSAKCNILEASSDC